MSNFQRELDLALALAEAKAERDAARADADRLAAAIAAYWSVDGHRNDEDGSLATWDASAFIEAKKRVAAALAAHDAARTGEEPAATLKWVDDTGAPRTMSVHVVNGLDFIVEYGRLTTDEQRVVVDFFMSEVAARAKEGQ